MVLQRHVVIAPLGNGLSFCNTLHSAGMFLARGLRQLLGLPWVHADHRHFHGWIATSPDSRYTIIDSQCIISGFAKRTAADFQTYRRRLPTLQERRSARLVILHDELGAPLGSITVRPTWASPSGHTLLDSCAKELSRTGLRKWTKIGVGIGDPAPGIGLKQWVKIGHVPPGLCYHQWIKTMAGVRWLKDGEPAGFRGWLPVKRMSYEDSEVITDSADQVLSLLEQDTWIFEQLEAQQEISEYRGPAPPSPEFM